MPRFDIRPTPNPNSVKIAAGEVPFIQHGMISASTATEADGNAMAEAILAIDGVANVFVLPQFMTVTKSEEASWDEVLSRLEDAITRFLPPSQ